MPGGMAEALAASSFLAVAGGSGFLTESPHRKRSVPLRASQGPAVMYKAVETHPRPGIAPSQGGAPASGRTAWRLSLRHGRPGLRGAE